MGLHVEVGKCVSDGFWYTLNDEEGMCGRYLGRGTIEKMG